MSMRVAFQGELGAYSEEAIRAGWPRAEPIPQRTVALACDRVRDGEADAALLPVENSQAGPVLEVFQTLEERELWATAEGYLKVRHCLLARPGVKLEDIRRVHSHPQALAQCQALLAAHGWEAVPSYDTAGAARLLAERPAPDEAALASAVAAERYGLSVLIADVQSRADNTTRFLLWRAEPGSGPEAGEPAKTSLVLTTPHQPGSLYHALGCFEHEGLNLSALTARPLGGGVTAWAYRFYLDVEHDGGDAALDRAMEALSMEGRTVKRLGTYARATTLLKATSAA